MHILILWVGLLQVSSVLVLRLLSLVAQVKVHHLALFHANLAGDYASWRVLDVVLKCVLALVVVVLPHICSEIHVLHSS